MMLARPRALFGALANRVLALLPLLAAGACLFAVQPAFAHHRHHGGSSFAGQSRTDPAKDAALILDGQTGKVLFARNAEEQRYPASLTKIMTLYMLFDALKKGSVTMQTPMPVSDHAAAQSPVKLHLRPGVDTINVEQAIKAVVVRSANDVAVVIAEKIGGSESHFAEMMTAKAHELGMSHTHYANASGLPNREQITTAGDLGILARRVTYDFPQYFAYFATPSFTWKGRTAETHDNLIGRYEGADGMKTGFTEMSGFNLVSSVTRGNVHLIGIVMGGRTARMRDREMIHLLDDTFERIRSKPALVAQNELPWRGAETPRRVQTMIAGFELPSATPSPRPVVQVAAVTPQLRPAGAVDPNDEDAAEARPDPANAQEAPDNEIANVIAPKPLPRLKTMMASYQPAKTAVAAAAAAAPPEAGALSSVATALGMHDWTIQIGAFADVKTARAQLEAYAEKSMDVLGQAERIVVPFRGVDGSTMFRARFGPFAEREARKVCERLTERGQTCFAATATR